MFSRIRLQTAVLASDSRRFFDPVTIVLLILTGIIPHASAQTSGDSLISGFQPRLPVVPDRLPPLSQRFQEASSFIDSLSKNDAMLEVVLGQGRLIVLKEDLVQDKGTGGEQPLIAVGNPDTLEFEIAGRRQIRLIGKRIGVTDLVVVTESQTTHSYEVHVVYDLKLVEAHIRELIPDVHVRLAQLGRNLVIEGQARDSGQIRQIEELVRRGVLVDEVTGSAGSGVGNRSGSEMAMMSPIGRNSDSGGDSFGPEIINLMRVPGPQQVMLKVQIAELNRTAMRQIGSDFLFADGNGRILGTRLSNATSSVTTSALGSGLAGLAETAAGPTSPATAFAIFEGAGFQMFVSALRQNSMLKILAEPNLVAMNGHEARFLAGGEFPVPVPQSGAGGGAATITVQYKKFGVQLNFVPYILDGGTIRLSVDPEVSSIDFSLGIEVSGTRVPGLNTRNAHTVVELQEGQTLAIAGLMQLSLSGNTRRIPGIGDLPYIGPFFSNTTSDRIEKELVVLVTPYLVEPMLPEEVSCRPGDEVSEPNDLEFYLLGRLQGRTGDRSFRSTVNSDDPLHLMRRLKLEQRCLEGPHGFSK